MQPRMFEPFLFGVITRTRLTEGHVRVVLSVTCHTGEPGLTSPIVEPLTFTYWPPANIGVTCHTGEPGLTSPIVEPLTFTYWPSANIGVTWHR